MNQCEIQESRFGWVLVMILRQLQDRVFSFSETKHAFLLLDQGLFLDKEVYHIHWCIIAKYWIIVSMQWWWCSLGRVWVRNKTGIARPKLAFLFQQPWTSKHRIQNLRKYAIDDWRRSTRDSSRLFSLSDPQKYGNHSSSWPKLGCTLERNKCSVTVARISALGKESFGSFWSWDPPTTTAPLART